MHFRKLFNTLFRDAKGNIVVGQWMNIPLAGWLICRVLMFFTDNEGIETLGQAFLFTWAYLEITHGVNLFREILGGTVMTVLISWFFLS